MTKWLYPFLNIANNMNFHYKLNHTIAQNFFHIVNSIILKFHAVLKFSAMIFNFPLFCNVLLYKSIWIYLLFDHEVDTFLEDEDVSFFSCCCELLLLSINSNVNMLFEGLKVWLVQNLMFSGVKFSKN